MNWIPTAERLPELEGDSPRFSANVLICLDDGFIEIGFLDSEGYWHHLMDETIMGDEVVAWQPLPRPYEP